MRNRPLPTLADARCITKFPLETTVKHSDGSPVIVEATGLPQIERRMMRLKFHLGRIVLTYPSGTVVTLTHTAKNGKHKVTWENHVPGIAPHVRTFYHPENLADFLVARYGLELTEEILLAIESLEQGVLV